MYWEDVLVDRPMAVDEISSWLSDVFGIARKDIVVAPSEAQAPLPPETAVLAEFSAAQGEFPFHLQVFLKREDLATRDSTAALEKLSRDHGVRILMSDDTANPYRMLLLRPGGEKAVVHLDADALDDQDSYIVSELEDQGP
jgi:hypothetical protein